MRTYILFIFGLFEDHQDIEYFCMEVIGQSNKIASIKYVIDHHQNNIIVIFDSEINEEKLKNEMSSLLDNENISTYFMFKKQDLVLSLIPKTIKDLIFKPTSDLLKIECSILKSETDFNLDDILDKIENEGIDSLTTDEKKFLDNFNL